MGDFQNKNSTFWMSMTASKINCVNNQLLSSTLPGKTDLQI